MFLHEPSRYVLLTKHRMEADIYTVVQGREPSLARGHEDPPRPTWVLGVREDVQEQDQAVGM
jgi:hypothetical protein